MSPYTKSKTPDAPASSTTATYNPPNPLDALAPDRTLSVLAKAVLVDDVGLGSTVTDATATVSVESAGTVSVAVVKDSVVESARSAVAFAVTVVFVWMIRFGRTGRGMPDQHLSSKRRRRLEYC
ncbi:hypothetical protein HKX48_009439 [Thoreauomyces humboldtii]|nr:hypothetical protein HKX48_009439 [Thoreauomyces humboldtii]